MLRIYVLDVVSAFVGVLEWVEPVASFVSSCIPVDIKNIASVCVVASVGRVACSCQLTECVLLHSLSSQSVVCYRTYGAAAGECVVANECQTARD